MFVDEQGWGVLEQDSLLLLLFSQRKLPGIFFSPFDGVGVAAAGFDFLKTAQPLDGFGGCAFADADRFLDIIRRRFFSAGANEFHL